MNNPQIEAVNLEINSLHEMLDLPLSWEDQQNILSQIVELQKLRKSLQNGNR